MGGTACVDRGCRYACVGACGPGGEDPFDAVAGLFGMVNVLLGRRAAGVPGRDEAVRRVEGWILGLAAPAG